ncbi:hypothetical protein AX769_06935 [Frondihabitans sp. PAMC 28766]|uniref:LysR family substrate-binding domain-containing protein n=1 Tax=Frondihabitans sp. PAMC 28766 TaxID=1795630 RepID=UPI00078B1F7E|nr:LysR family substrate-binding domain-containing protein [Frondihabitans sp. PAMC 28766]AMM19942.1 hypothetical protein AX769_06935 [Frondihabitans sp. PAMC 28766]
MTDQTSFRVGFVPGVTLTKWSRVWAERHPELALEAVTIGAQDPTAHLADDDLAVVFARLPVPAEGFHSIALYDEQPVVVLPKEHALAEFMSFTAADLEGEPRFDLDPALSHDEAMQVETVASGAGIAIMPQSLARLYGRKGITVRPITDLPPTTIALVWPEGATTPEVDDFIGVVRGRTANSSRAGGDEAPADKIGPVAKAKAKRAAAAEAAGTAGAKGTARGSRKTPPRGRGSGPRKGRR